MRGKYRSAVYVFSDAQAETVKVHIEAAQSDFTETLVTMTLPFEGFDHSSAQFHDYYKSNPDRPFCTTYIDPKLSKIRKQFANYYDHI